MRANFNRFSLFILVVIAGAGLLGLAAPARAATTATISLSPATSTVNVGDNLVINVMANTAGQAMVTSQIRASFPTAIFDSATIGCGADAPTGGSVASGQPDQVYATCGNGSGVTGANIHIATITLHAAAAGTGNIALLLASTDPHSAANGGTTNNGSETDMADSTPASILDTNGLTGGSYTVTGTASSGNTDTDSVGLPKAGKVVGDILNHPSTPLAAIALVVISIIGYVGYRRRIAHS